MWRMSSESQKEIMAKAEEWIREAGAEFLLKLFGIYAVEADKCVAQIRRSFDEKDAVGLTQAAHTLKSSSANVGAASLSSLAKEIELASREGRMAELAGQVARLEEEHLQVKCALQAARVKYAAG